MLYSLPILNIFEVMKELMDHTFHYDLFVVGDGIGGYELAKQAGHLGSKVGLSFLSNKLTPSKVFSFGNYSNILQFARQFVSRVDCNENCLSKWNSMQNGLKTFANDYNTSCLKDLKDLHVDCYHTSLNFESANTLNVDQIDGNPSLLVSAKYIAIAVDAKQVEPTATSLTISCETLLSQQSPPGKTLIIGGTPTGLECAGILCQLGFDTTILIRNSLLRGFDSEISGLLAKKFETEGAKFIYKALPIEMKKTEKGQIQVTFRGIKGGAVKKEIFDTVVLADNIRPNVDFLKVENAGLSLSAIGTLKANSDCQTEIPNIFAVGSSVTGRPSFADIKNGQLLGCKLFGKDKESISLVNSSFNLIHTLIEYGSCGVSEKEAIGEYGEESIEIQYQKFKPLELPPFPKMQNEEYFVKIIVSKIDGRIVGLHYLGPNASQITFNFSYALNNGLNMSQWNETSLIYPIQVDPLSIIKYTKSIAPKKGTC